jgi:hypothetical protein
VFEMLPPYPELVTCCSRLYQILWRYHIVFTTPYIQPFFTLCFLSTILFPLDDNGRSRYQRLLTSSLPSIRSHIPHACIRQIMNTTVDTYNVRTVRHPIVSLTGSATKTKNSGGLYLLLHAPCYSYLFRSLHEYLRIKNKANVKRYRFQL